MNLQSHIHAQIHTYTHSHTHTHAHILQRNKPPMQEPLEVTHSKIKATKILDVGQRLKIKYYLIV